MNIQKKAFTLVELIVSVMIVAILASIGFYSYVGYLSEARDAERKANIGEIKTALKLYKQKRGAYPVPGDYFQIVNNTETVALQGKLNENVKLSTMDSIPLDPFTDSYYFYSTTKNRQETQIALTLENGEFPITLMDGDYKTISKYVLPSILLATGSVADVEINIGVPAGVINRDLFILDGGINLPYELSAPYNPVYGGEDIDDVVVSGNVNFWQNSDFRTCTEIDEAAKFIHTTGTEEYQILDDTGSFTTTGCILP